jgi:hypothetical protein
MSTGLDSFSNPDSIGPLYPFVGWEVPLVAVGVVVWIGWHVVQTRAESRAYRKAVELYEEIGLDRAMHHGGGGHIAHGPVDPDEPTIRTGSGGPGTTGRAEPKGLGSSDPGSH